MEYFSNCTYFTIYRYAEKIITLLPSTQFTQGIHTSQLFLYIHKYTTYVRTAGSTVLRLL